MIVPGDSLSLQELQASCWREAELKQALLGEGAGSRLPPERPSLLSSELPSSPEEGGGQVGLEARPTLSREAGGLRQRLRAAQERSQEAEESSRALQVGGEFLGSGVSSLPLLHSLVARLSSGLVARLSSGLVARLSSSLVARLSSSLVARLSSSLVARLSSSLVARLSSSLVARLSSSLVARLSSSLIARLSSSLVARLSSSLVARLSSSLVARLSSSLVARLSSSLVARLSSSLVARLSSSLVARLLSRFSSLASDEEAG